MTRVGLHISRGGSRFVFLALRKPPIHTAEKNGTISYSFGAHHEFRPGRFLGDYTTTRTHSYLYLLVQWDVLAGAKCSLIKGRLLRSQVLRNRTNCCTLLYHTLL